MDSQKQYWESEKILRRRTPQHPVIEAFAMPKVQRIVELTSPQNPAEHNKNRTLLDVGCGNGYISYYLDQYFDVTCVDFSHSILTICPVEKRVQALATALPFRDNSFDIAFCSNLLHHLDDPVMALKEMARVSNRYVAVLEPNRSNLLMFLFSFMSRNDRALRRFSRKYITGLARNCDGFETIYLAATGSILPNMTPLSLLPVFKKIDMLPCPRFFNLLVLRKTDCQG